MTEPDYTAIEERMLAFAQEKRDLDAKLHPPMTYHGSVTGRFSASHKPRWNTCPGAQRKLMEERSCPDDKCMAGLNGRCVACGDEQ